MDITNKIKSQLEENLKIQNNEMQKFQYEYEDQLSTWKKEKGDMQARFHELVASSDKVRHDTQEQIELYKHKYNDYKTKLKRANASIQTLTGRVAKYEMQMAAEREIGRVDSIRLPGRGGSDLSGAGLVAAQRIGNLGVKSSNSAMSPGLVMPN